MAAYVISEVEMLDETQGRRYRELAAGSVARHGGRYLVREGEKLYLTDISAPDLRDVAVSGFRPYE